MGILFGGWAREEEESRQWYIDKYGLETGLQKWEEDNRRPRKDELSKLPPPVYTTQKPRVGVSDVIANPDNLSEQAYIQRIEDDWPYVIFMNKAYDGAAVKWPYKEWKLFSYAIGEFDDIEQIKKERGLK